MAGKPVVTSTEGVLEVPEMRLEALPAALQRARCGAAVHRQTQIHANEARRCCGGAATLRQNRLTRDR